MNETAIPNPEYFEIEHYPCVGQVRGFLVFDTTRPRLTEDEYVKQCKALGITPHRQNFEPGQDKPEDQRCFVLRKNP